MARQRIKLNTILALVKGLRPTKDEFEKMLTVVCANLSVPPGVFRMMTGISRGYGLTSARLIWVYYMITSGRPIEFLINPVFNFTWGRRVFPGIVIHSDEFSRDEKRAIVEELESWIGKPPLKAFNLSQYFGLSRDFLEEMAEQAQYQIAPDDDYENDWKDPNSPWMQIDWRMPDSTIASIMSVSLTVVQVMRRRIAELPLCSLKLLIRKSGGFYTLFSPFLKKAKRGSGQAAATSSSPTVGPLPCRQVSSAPPSASGPANG